MIKIVTSFGPSRVQRQQECLQSWIDCGCTVVGVQSPGEAESMQALFPQAEIIETDLVGDVFGKPKFVRIKALVDQAKDGDILILNSDIQAVQDRFPFRKEWEVTDRRTLKVGIRWDALERGISKRIFKWGIDAFVITPEIASILPDIGLAMGCPVWDYWLPWYMHVMAGFKIETVKKYRLRHVVHNRNWSRDDYRRGFDIVKEHYGISEYELTYWVQDITGRRHLKNWAFAK